MPTTPPPPAPTGNGAPPESRGSRPSPTAGVLDLDLNGHRYQARWAQLGTVEHLKVNIRVYPNTNGNGSLPAHIETIDLYSSHSRRKFAGRVAGKLEAPVEAIEEEVSELLVAVDKLQQEIRAVQSGQPAAEAKPEMTVAERRAALAFLEKDDLLDQVARDIDTLGYVGEETNKKLAYLIAVSRKLPDPLSAIIVSQSGAGKSALAGIIERLVPPEDVVFWSRLTPQALYYVDKDFLKRKLVVIEEREGSEAADYSIRALQSKHKLVQAVPIKDPATGNIRTHTMEVDGPSAFLETTTRDNINPENASRSFEIYLDESRAQTERVHRAQRASKTPAGIDRRGRRHAVETLHHNAQRLLEPVAVAIPYAELLTYPRSWMRTRRDNLRLLNLIEAIAFFYQKQRKRERTDSGQEYIAANVEDYAIAYALAGDIFGFGLDELRKPVRELLGVIETSAHRIAEERGTKPELVELTQRDIREWSGLPHHQVKRAIGELEELEYVEVRRSQRGSRNVYRLVERTSERKRINGLLTPVELFNRIADAQKGNGKTASASRARRRGKKVGQSGNRPCSPTFSRKR